MSGCERKRDAKRNSAQPKEKSQPEESRSHKEK